MNEEKVTKEILRLREQVTILEDLLKRWLQFTAAYATYDIIGRTANLVDDTRNALYGKNV